MKKSNIVLVLCFFAVVLFLVGLFANENIMRVCAIGLIISTSISFFLTWVEPIFLSKKTVLTNLAIATSYAFITLMVLIGFVFLVNILVASNFNLSFAVFGSMFVSMCVARFYVAHLMEEYVGR